MQPLNPFLAAFFKSSLPDQCSDPSSHVLLVPATDFLLSYKETSSVSTADFITSEEFLASHVIKIQTGGVNLGGKDKNDAIQQNIRESRGKPRSYPTINNRSIIIRENFIFTNKGFKSANESQLLHDSLWYADNFDSKQWLIYYITRPLLGTWQEEPIKPAIFREGMGRKLNPRHRSAAARALTASMEASSNGADSSKAVSSTSPSAANFNRKKKQIRLFHELLNAFPVVAKHMQPGLERLFNDFRLVFEKPLPPPPSCDDIPDPEPETQFEQALRRKRANSNASRRSSDDRPSSAHVPNGNEHIENALPVTENYYAEDDEDLMRASLETAISSAIELFRTVDRQTLAIIHNTTTLVLTDVEKLIERYVTENVHFILFPRLCALKRPYDRVLEAKIRQMAHIDVSQLGIAIHGGARGKHELVTQLGLAITEFRKISTSMSPHVMLELLLSTMKRATDITESSTTKPGTPRTPGGKPVLTVNADTLVSLLLFVVIRAQVKNLQARLVYIRNFIYFEDVDTGEMGYALSTFEAVLAYLSIDSSGLRRASHRNKELWDAVTSGDLGAVRSNMEPCSVNMISSTHGLYNDLVSSRRQSLASNGVSRRSSASGLATYGPYDAFSGGSNLGHVFPFTNGTNHQNAYEFPSDDDDDDDDLIEEDQIEHMAVTPKKIKRVMMDVGSVSSESEFSYQSVENSDGSINSALEGDISVERISQTHDANGQSILMMAVQNGRTEVLRYLLSLSEYFPAQVVLADMNIEDTTLLSAAVQLGNAEIIDILLDYFMEFVDQETLIQYCAIQDTKGRSFGHYLIHAPHHINRTASLVPWQQKDNNGQTPLFTLCRSYDQANYRTMVAAGLYAAQEYQRDGMPLHIEDHMDNRGNTLLHIVHDPQMTTRILTQCDIDVNSVNDRAFTPLMLATKYGRYETIRVLYAEPRVDIAARELRGLTAVELAKDDEVRNRIDDLALFAMQPGPDQRLTGVVRGFFVEDATIRLMVKSAAPSLTAGEGAENRTYTVTTCRRSLSDFETLEELLALENPYSWMPLVGAPRSPFQIHSKPSRAVLQDIQTRADWFLRVMLSHPTFSTHEMLWEFFLVPELKLDQMTIRSELKAATLAEKIREEMEPVKDVREVESFVDFARDSIRGINHRTRSVTRRINGVVVAASDLSDSTIMFQRALKTAHWLPIHYQAAFHLYVRAMSPTRSNATMTLHSTFIALQGTIDALLKSMDRPVALANQIRVAQRAMERNYNSIGKAPRWPLGIMDDARQRQNDEREAKALKSRDELLNLGRELRHCQQVVAGELAGWQELHAKMVKKAMKDYAVAMILQERERMDGLVRSLRKIRMPPREMLQAQFEKEQQQQQQEMMMMQTAEEEGEAELDDGVRDAGEGSSSSSHGF